MLNSAPETEWRAKALRILLTVGVVFCVLCMTAAGFMPELDNPTRLLTVLYFGLIAVVLAIYATRKE